MVAETKTSVKARFETNDQPTQADFVNLIDSYQDTSTTLDTIITAVSGNSVAGLVLVTDGASGITKTNTLALQEVSASAVRATIVSADTVNSQTIIASAGRFTLVSADTIEVSGTLTAGTITDHHFFFRNNVTVQQEDFVPSTPYRYTVVGVRRVTTTGSCRINLRKNQTPFLTIDVSAGVASAAVSAEFAIGDTLDVAVSAADSVVSGLAVYVQHTRSL